MAVQRSVNWLSQQRVDLPDLRAIESASRNDFDQLIQAFVTNTTQGYIMRGFNILMANAIGGASSSLLLQVDPGALLHIDASQSGTVYMVPTGTPNQILNASVNTNVSGSFVPNAVNYVTVDYIRFADSTTDAQVYLWDPTTDTETTINSPRAVILDYVINISTATPTPNLLPIATVITDGGNNVLTITDDRWLLCRLGTGGLVPNPLYVYPWTQGRTENPVTSSSDSIDPFSGGDKNIGSLKEWMNAVMSILGEIKGTTYWYSASSEGSLSTLLEDLGNTVVTSAGNISHGIIPNSTPILSTTGNVTVSSNQLTSLASVVGLANGDLIVGTGIPSNTTITNISGSTVTMSANSSATATGLGISFYQPSVITAPGQINWNQPIYLDVIGSSLKYSLASNTNSTDITLSDDEVAYITLIRGITIAPNLIWTQGSPTVTSVGAISWTSLLQPNDFIKLASDPDSKYYQILSVDSLTQVTLVNNFTETSTGPAGAVSQYAFGSYTHSPTPSTNRDIFIAPRPSVPVSGNTFWLFMREDNGGSQARVYVRFLGLELSQGEDLPVSDTIPAQLLQYIGSPIESASAPQYVSSLYPGSVQQQTLLSFGAEATIPQSSYFLISASSRTYYVWFNENGAGVDPAPNALYIPIPIALTTGMTEAQVAAAVTSGLNSTADRDFEAVQQAVPNTNEVLVTNTSAGATSPAVDGDVGAPFAITIEQSGTGVGNNVIQDGDNLTLAIKELDQALGAFIAEGNAPEYDEAIDIVASGATPPNSLNGPISSGTDISLPPNSRLGDTEQRYIVGRGYLQVFLNGQYLRLGQDWLEVGAAGTFSNQFQILRVLDVGDAVELRIDIPFGGGGPPGVAGPTGPMGTPGHDAAGGPVAISTKSANYTVMLSDNVLLANCSSGPIVFSLPSAASATGHVFYFKKIDSSINTMTIQGFGSQLIDGAITINTIDQFDSFTLVTDGTQFWIL